MTPLSLPWEFLHSCVYIQLYYGVRRKLFSHARVSRSPIWSEARADGAVVLRCDRRLDGDLGTHRGRVAVKIAVESEQTREREACLGFDRRRQPIQWRRSAWSTRTLSWLILGAPSSKRRFAVVDAVPTPTPTPLLDAIRARAEICVLRAGAGAQRSPQKWRAARARQM